VEQIDLLPTFVEVEGGRAADLDHILEGHGLTPLLHGQTQDLSRAAAISEYDLAFSPLAERLGLHPARARLMMVADRRWQMFHSEDGSRPILFDLHADPLELVDLGASPDHATGIDAMYGHLNAWARRLSQRQTMSTAQVAARRHKAGGWAS
jgi:arylsulfatase A-like enzyme